MLVLVVMSGTQTALGCPPLTFCLHVDLFCGMPLVLAGKYNGTWPETVQLNGRLPDGTGMSDQTPLVAYRSMISVQGADI
jgi:hypothetical protein